MVKCPVDAIYIQVLSQLQVDDYFANSNVTYVNLVTNANDSYKQLLLSVGEYVNRIIHTQKCYCVLNEL